VALVELKRGACTQGSRTGQKWWILKMLCFEFAYKYPWSASWLHTYARVLILGAVWELKKVEPNSVWRGNPDGWGDNGLHPAEWPPMDPAQMMKDYDAGGPHELSPLAKMMEMDRIYRPDSPNYREIKYGPIITGIREHQRKKAEEDTKS